jgi:sugar lactone lactonase YvrE
MNGFLVHRVRDRLAVAAAMAMASVLMVSGGLASASGLEGPSGPHGRTPGVRELTTFAAPGCTGACGSGSTIGPDRALYVTDGPGGRVLRVDPRTGATTTFADGLPGAIPAVGIGGAMDVVFLHGVAYVLVTLVGPEFGQPDVVSGVYRIGRDGDPRVFADVGAWSQAHPPATDFFITSGVQYALERYRGGLLVSDGHHNRVLRVSRDGQIRQLRAFDNVVPTGLEVHGRTITMAEAGPIPHQPEDGRVVEFSAGSLTREVAAGAPLLVDVERGRAGRIYALSQGTWDLPPTPENEGKPASPGTGRLLVADRHGELVPVAEGLDRPTSFEILGDSALVITLTGKVLRIDGLSCGASRP